MAEHLIFVNYAHSDRERVRPVYQRLKNAGFRVWIDLEILPGQDWDFEIKRAQAKANVVIAFISRESSMHRGYVQRELRFALDRSLETLSDDIYLIPVLLDNVDIPEPLKQFQAIRTTEDDFDERLVASLEYQLKRLGAARDIKQQKGDLTWSTEIVRDSWEGLPGYEVELSYLRLQSDRYPNISWASDCIRTDLLKALLDHRSVRFRQESTFFNYGQEPFRRTNTLDAYCNDPIVKGKVLSVQCTLNWYGAGAAHPNEDFRTYSFVLDPLSVIPSFADIFSDPDEALPVVQSMVRQKLLEPDVDLVPGPNLLDEGKVVLGTTEWDDFQNFLFGDESIRLLFPPYQVGPYAAGAQSVELQYPRLSSQLRPGYLSALDLS